MKAVWLVPWRFNSSKPFGLMWVKEPVRALGTFISYNVKENDKKNVEVKIDNMNTKLDIWRARNLSLLDKCLNVKCLGIAHLVYSALMLVIPNTYIPVIKNSVFNFIWNKKQDKIKRDVMYQGYSNGGLHAPNVEILFKSLHLAWIFRFVVRDQNFLETWKSIPNYFFKKYGGFNFLLRCNYDKKFLEKSNIPHFYRQILANFLELKTLYGLQNESDVFLFNNKDILIDGHTIFYCKWFEKGIISIQDTLDHTGKFLTFHEFQKKYGVKCNFLNYLQVLSAIPKHLHVLQKARTISPIDKHNLSHNTIYQLSTSITIDLAKMRCKDYYCLYINAVKIEPTGPKKWVKDLSLNNFNWERAFPRISQV